jgi:hypothetical protein
MFSVLPTDVSRKIALQAIRQRNEDVGDEILKNIARAFESTVTGSCITDVPLFSGSSKRLKILPFTDVPITHGMRSAIYATTLWVGDDKFVLTKDVHYDQNQEDDYTLYACNDNSKYLDIVKDSFQRLF